MDLQQKLTRAFFICFALLMGVGMHYFQHNQGGSGLQLAFNNVVWIFFSILIGLGLWKITAQQKIYYSKYTGIIFIALALFILPIFYPNNELAEQSYTRLLGLFAGILLFLSLQQFNFNQKQVEKLLLWIVIAGFIQAAYSLTQDYLLPADNIFGYNINYGRPYGIFQQPNVLASFMATSLILSGYLLAKFEDKRIRAFLLITALANMWVISLAMSRVGYLGTTIAVLLLLPWLWQKNKKCCLLFLLSIAVGISLTSIKEDALQARDAKALKQDNRRVTMYLHSLELVKDKPLLGHGYGSFEKAFITSYAERAKNGEVAKLKQVLSHPHNDTLFWAVEGGIAPIFAMLLLIGAFLSRLRAFKVKKALALLALVTPISFHTQTEYPLYHSAVHWLVLMVLVFYVDHQSQEINVKGFTRTFFLRVAGILIPLFTAIFMVTNLFTIAKITKFERSKNPDIRILMDIINPLVFEDNFSVHTYNFRLNVAVNTRSPNDTYKIIKELEAITSKYTKPYYYQLLHFAYSYTGQPEKAKAIMEHALYLYPMDKGLLREKQRAESMANASSLSQATSSALPSEVTSQGQ